MLLTRMAARLGATSPISRAIAEAGVNGVSAAITAIFAVPGTAGAWYDSTTGLFQSAQGDAAAVNGVTSLRLDKSAGATRGAEIIADPSFNDATKWTFTQPTSGAVSVSGGSLSLVSLDGTFATASIAAAVAAVPGKAYEYELDITAVTGAISVTIGGTGSLSFTTPGVKRGIIVAGSITTPVVKRDAACNATVASFSVKMVAGNHASQATSGFRPLLKGPPNYVEYDGVDDKLATVFPNLGTDVTIGRAIPGVGAQILTGQTVAAGTFNDAISNAALVVVNRALAAGETAGFTAYLEAVARQPFYDDFLRADGAIGVSSSSRTWVQVPAAAQKVLAVISGNTLLVPTPNPSGVTAAYSGVDMGVAPTAMFAKISFAAGAAGGAAVLVSNPSGLDTVAQITGSSFHVTFGVSNVSIGIFSGGVLTTTVTKTYNAPITQDGTVYTIGWDVVGTTVRLYLPDGAVSSHTDARHTGGHGRYATWEHYCNVPTEILPVFHRVWAR